MAYRSLGRSCKRLYYWTVTPWLTICVHLWKLLGGNWNRPLNQSNWTQDCQEWSRWKRKGMPRNTTGRFRGQEQFNRHDSVSSRRLEHAGFRLPRSKQSSLFRHAGCFSHFLPYQRDVSGGQTMIINSFDLQGAVRCEEQEPLSRYNIVQRSQFAAYLLI